MKSFGHLIGSLLLIAVLFLFQLFILFASSTVKGDPWQVYYESEDESAYRFSLNKEVSGVEVWLYVSTVDVDQRAFDNDWIELTFVGKPTLVATSSGQFVVEPIIGLARIGYKGDGEKSAGGLHAVYYVLPKNSFVSYVNVTLHAMRSKPRLNLPRSYLREWRPIMDVVQLETWHKGWRQCNVTLDCMGRASIISFGAPVGDQPMSSGLNWYFGRRIKPPRLAWKPDIYVEVGYVGGINIAPESFAGTGNYRCKINVGVGCGRTLNEGVANGLQETIYMASRGSGSQLIIDEAASGYIDIGLDILQRISDSPAAKAAFESLGYASFVLDLINIILTLGFDETVAGSRILAFKDLPIGEDFFAYFNFYAETASAGLSGGIVNFWGKCPFGQSVFDNLGFSVVSLPNGGMQIGGILFDYHIPDLTRLSGPVIIRDDGCIDPFTAPLKTEDYIVYKLEDDLNVSLTVERSNILLDGGNHTVFGLIISRISNSTIRFFNVVNSDPGVDVSCYNTEIYGIQVIGCRNGLKAVSQHSTFRNLIIVGGSINGFEISGWENRICNVHVNGFELGFYLCFLEDSVVSENTVEDCRVGIYLYCSWRNRISSNKISNCSECGVKLFGQTVENNEICENIINCSTDGIQSLGAASNKIEGNRIHGGSKVLELAESMLPPPTAILIQSSAANSGFKISKNVITAYPHGIRMHFTGGSTISANVIMDCRVAIYLAGSERNEIRENSLMNNNLDVYFEVSGNNILYHNNFIDGGSSKIGGELIEGITPYNTWDNGYPAGGNFWGDYAGNDGKHGPGQDNEGADGIGDLPYQIDKHGVDRYPLMEPYGELPPVTYIFQLGNVSIRLTSNSIVTGFTCDLADRKILFEVYWRNGTRGFVDIYAPKNAFQGEPTVLFDGTSIPFNKSEDDVFKRIQFTYEHSRHLIEIRFRTENTLIFTIAALIVTAAALTSIICLIRRRTRSASE
ncbi:MAG: right-handed parallel beta-helix repeat-containing protein [Candidatus Bathyarchaeota archaeon]|nr:right-handed parallel beta-helix repeat-containing protein [Candidatus Bathyarchaeota archaeon]MCX8177571.1 right-handed parallel beta-helix repeat-containing protein [Candidatus Bathyarchaeota archaeon]